MQEAFPDKMISMVLADAAPKVCVTSAALAHRLPASQTAIVMSAGWETREVGLGCWCGARSRSNP